MWYPSPDAGHETEKLTSDQVSSTKFSSSWGFSCNLVQGKLAHSWRGGKLPPETGGLEYSRSVSQPHVFSYENCYMLRISQQRLLDYVGLKLAKPLWPGVSQGTLCWIAVLSGSPKSGENHPERSNFLVPTYPMIFLSFFVGFSSHNNGNNGRNVRYVILTLGRQHLRLSGAINEAPYSWMVYNGKSENNMDDLGVSLFQETSICIYIYI